MQHIERMINSLDGLTPVNRTVIRTAVLYCLKGSPNHLPKVGPGWIDKHDYAAIRRMAIEESYKRRVAGQTWDAKKDKAL